MEFYIIAFLFFFAWFVRFEVLMNNTRQDVKLGDRAISQLERYVMDLSERISCIEMSESRRTPPGVS